MINRLIILLVICFTLISCSKTEKDFLWEKSFGKGQALHIENSHDSGFFITGKLEGNPYFMRFDRSGEQLAGFGNDMPGVLTSAWFDTSGYITGGSSEGKMLLMRHNIKEDFVWEKIIDTGLYISNTFLFYEDNGNLMAIGSASSDSVVSLTTGLLFVKFDTTGKILEAAKIEDPDFLASDDAVIDNDGNIYFAFTRSYNGGKLKASVSKYNNIHQKVWETKLYNNPNFGAASITINLDDDGNIYVGGKTELSVEDGVLDNSFLVSLSENGSVEWKSYLESSNAGVDIIFDGSNDIMMLNKNCFIISRVSVSDGSDKGRMRMLSICDPYNTEVIGRSMLIDYNGKIVIAGSRNGDFYLAMK